MDFRVRIITYGCILVVVKAFTDHSTLQTSMHGVSHYSDILEYPDFRSIPNLAVYQEQRDSKTCFKMQLCEDLVNESQIIEADMEKLIEENMPKVKESTKSRVFREIGRAALLSHNEEMELGTKIQQLTAMDSIRHDLECTLRRQPSTSEWAEACGYPIQESDLFKDYYMDCLRAKHAMVESNMRLVIAVAKRYGWMGIPITDLVQEGSLGLIRAVEKYDPTRGFKFSTYASWWIQQSICKSVAYKSRTIRLPVHVHNILATVRRARKQLISELGRAPTPKELAYRTGIPQDRLQKYVRASRHALKMDITSNNSLKYIPQDHIAEILEARDTLQPEDSAEIGAFRAGLKEVVRTLPEEERAVMILRFGLEDGISRSLSEVGSELCCPKPWVKKVELKALRSLRDSRYKHILKEFSETIPSLSEGTSAIQPTNW